MFLQKLGFHLSDSPLLESTPYSGSATLCERLRLDMKKDLLSRTLPLLYIRLHMQAVVLMGHSTGCQDAVRYAAKYGKAEDGPPVLGYILQAPASHRPAKRLKAI